MSHWWPDALKVLSRQRTLVALTQIQETSEVADGLVPSGDWQKSLEQLRLQLAAISGSGKYVECIVSQEFLRQGLVPFQQGLSEKEELAYLRFALNNIYGDIGEDWALTWQQAGIGKAWGVCAIENALLLALEQLCAEFRVKLASIKPLISVVDAQWQSQPSSGWLVLVEAGRMTLSYANKGMPEMLRSIRINDDWPELLPALIDREQVILESQKDAVFSEQRISVCAPYAASMPANLRGRADYVWLPLNQAVLSALKAAQGNLRVSK